MGDDYIIGADHGSRDGGTLLRDPGRRRLGQLRERRRGVQLHAARGLHERVRDRLYAGQLHDVHGPDLEPVTQPHVAIRQRQPQPDGEHPAGDACTLTSAVTNSWPGGSQLQLTITNSGTTLCTGWTAGFCFADTSETITSSWNAAVSQSGAQVSAINESYNAPALAGGSTTSASWSPAPSRTLSGLTCTLS